ncbi:MAG: glycoside hydrolase family 2 TIM barrel-domain containing protein [Lachnospiraceae bacterium]
MIVPRYYEDLTVLHENTMPARAYYIPASGRMDDLVEHREASDRIQFLNGTWKFKFFESIYDVKDKFYEEGFDVSEYDDMKVPSVWQMAGYDTHQYTNIRYPFPFDPPYVPQDIPCGTYVYEFEYVEDKEAGKAFLNFEGVDSCFYIWLNGEYVGYSQVPHATSEFDVSKVIKEGKNTIAVLVMKWCDGSYLDDQDKFRMSGIFRDVYLLKRPEKCIRDYRITTQVEKTSAKVRLEVLFTESTQAKVTIEDKNGAVMANGEISENGKIELEIVAPTLWNTENPYLYTLILETENETIVDYIGLRTIEIKENVIYFNGQKIKFRGVNRHDSDPKTGFAIDIDQLMIDLTMMKQHNFNAIRSSHYPNAPYFYQLCDKFGFMVVNEADIEAHGPFMIYRKEDTDYNRFKRWNEKIADDPAWEEAIMDRIQLMIKRDKNRPCIVMWSAGNESSYGCNFEKALKWMKEYDPDRLTHYEGARYRNYDVTYNYDNLDMYSRMYPALEEIHEYLEKDASKPFWLVEYSHSMGNGPGDFEDYFQLMQKHDLLCGGFVWEWCDHAIDKGKAENGKTVYFYGGDHGETIHDGNFCMDGLVYPDRTPHTGLFEYKNVYRPARVVSYDTESKRLVLHNYMDFDDLKDYVTITYEVTCDGLTVESGKLPAFSVAPHSEASTELDVVIPAKGRVYLKIHYRLKKEMALIPNDYVLGFDEILIRNEDGRNQTALKWLDTELSSEIEVLETDCQIILKGKAFCYVYSKKNGMFEQIRFAGRDYLDKPMEANIWRAPTDNDMYIKAEWKKAHYHEAYIRAYDSIIFQSKDGVEIKTKASVSAATVQKILDIDMIWNIDGNGGITSTMNVVKNDEFPDLPRFGVRLFLNNKLENVSYYGMGPYESYRDKHRASCHGLYRAKVSEMHEDYIRPQENGSHFDCDYVEITSSQFGLAAASEETFSFNTSEYTQEVLEYAGHNFELSKSGSTVFCLDYAQNGIGSNSCGPYVEAPYRFDDVEFKFQFKLVPFVKE